MIYKKFIIGSIFCTISFISIGCEKENAAEKTIEPAGESKTTISVEAMVVKEKLVEQKLPLTGILTPKNSVDIIAEVSGKVKSISKNLGEYVEAGQVLALVDDIIPESHYKQAEAQVLSTENNLKIINSNLQSDKSLFKSGDISQLEYESSILAMKNAEAQHLSSVAALSAARKTFEDTRIKSPINGYISRKYIDFGTMVSIGTAVFRVVDLSKMKVEVSVPQDLINKVRKGGQAYVIISAINNEHFIGFVDRMSPQADESTGGFSIEIIIDNKNNLIKAGMTAKIELLLRSENMVLAIPDYSIVSKNDESFVYKITNGSANLQKINISKTLGSNILVSKGLSIGDTIVVVGMKNLGLETKVKIEEMH